MLKSGLGLYFLRQYFGIGFWRKEISVVGPVKILAQIETSKGFTRDLLKKYGIDSSPKFKRFNSLEGSSAFIDALSEEYVIKFDVGILQVLLHNQFPLENQYPKVLFLHYSNYSY